VKRKRVRQWTFYKRHESAVARIKKILADDL
jgi:hypothetical protein